MSSIYIWTIQLSSLSDCWECHEGRISGWNWKSESHCSLHTFQPGSTACTSEQPSSSRRLWKLFHVLKRKSQLLALPFFAGSRPVASRYLLIISSWVLGKHGWYLLYSIVYSPFPWRVGERIVRVRVLSKEPSLAVGHTPPVTWCAQITYSEAYKHCTEACRQRHKDKLYLNVVWYKIIGLPAVIKLHVNAQRIQVFVYHYR